jgi:hypothetical protein
VSSSNLEKGKDSVQEDYPMTHFADARRNFHAALLESVLTVSDTNVASNADKDSKTSKEFALSIATRIGSTVGGSRLAGQSSGRKFENICKDFIEATFLQLEHLRPGTWSIESTGSRDRNAIAQYQQYSHLVDIARAAKEHRELAAFLGNDYTITPDIVIGRVPESDDFINSHEELVGDDCSTKADLRQQFNPFPILHASISCKWTMRSDRAQNSRSEALNLIRNRKGHLPHVAVITGEPLPSRIASISLGTGDIDCVYHFALYELYEAVSSSSYEDSKEILNIMIDGKRLKDISDLPLDLAV